MSPRMQALADRTKHELAEKRRQKQRMLREVDVYIKDQARSRKRPYLTK